MPLSKEKMREYQRRRRAKGLQDGLQTDVNHVKCKPISLDVNPICKPKNVNLVNPICPDCIKLQCQLDDALAEIDRLRKPKPVKSLLSYKSNSDILPYSKAKQARCQL